MLVLTRKVGERIQIGDVMITITRHDKSSVKIGIEAPDSMRIRREAAIDFKMTAGPKSSCELPLRTF